MKFTCSLLMLLSVAFSFSQGTQLLRQPSISNSEIVFVYANDLWKVPLAGGNATRLTSDTGYETSPHFSKDGKHIAFTAQYDGNFDVFVIPSTGGEPKRMTYHPSMDMVQGWTPDTRILFRSNRESRPTQTNKFFTIGLDEVMPTTFDIPRAAYGDISDDGSHIAYTPITSWDPEWRNYRGGQAMPIWIVNLKTKELTTTPQPTKERHLDPVWLNGIVYYLSERDYASNIWSFDPKTKEEKQLTFHKQFDVKSLDAHGDQMVYEQGGYIHLMNPSNGNSTQLNITVNADLNFSRPRWENVSGRQLSNPNVSPTGERAIFEHRGEIFTVPKEHGTWRNLTNTSGSADRSPIWSPKGDRVAWFSDQSGEYQLVLADQYGQNQTSIPLANSTFYFQPDWSPDGKHIAYTDTDYNLWLINLDSKKVVKADVDNYAHPNRSMNPQWSPDSKWIAYSKQNKSHFKSIFAYNVDSKEIIQITDPVADAISPVWDESGKYLYTLASTNYGLTSGWLDMSSYDNRVERSLFAVILNPMDDSPIDPRSNEENSKDQDTKDDKKGDATKDKKDDKSSENSKDEKEATKVVIDKNGIFNRTVHLDLPTSTYVALFKAPSNQVFVAEMISGADGMKIHNYDVKEQEAKDFEEAVSSFSVSNDRKTALIEKNGAWAMVNTTGKANFAEGKIETNIKVLIDPKAEYHQIFKEGWRYMRDFLYVDNVHGAPWDKVYEWYAPWIDHVNHRTDLNYVVDIMSGEVAIGHSYVSGGDLPNVTNVPVGLLGADLEKSGTHYKISKIYTGEQWNTNMDAPLALTGSKVKEGDFIMAINGKPLTSEQNPYQLLEQTAGREINITVNDSPNMKDARTVLIKPVSNENGLRYVDWVENNRRKVDELSNGKLAYVYVPNTGQGGFTSFNRYYFSQQDKKGVVIDERNNGGGSAADYMIDIMSRELFGYFNSKANDNRPWTTPMAGIWGPKVMIINERAGSGGDLLPYMFKEKNLGPLIGTRTWGGLVGTWDTPPFIDGGRMVAPRGGFYDVNGRWAVEGEGVAPDIEVIQTPKMVLQGKDPQLERAVEEAMKLLNENEFQLKPEPAPPVRWKRPDGFKAGN